MIIIIKIRLYRKLYTMCYLSEDNILLLDKSCYKPLGIKWEDSLDKEFDVEMDTKKKCIFSTNAYFLKPFILECLYSDVYRWKVLNYLRKLSGYSAAGCIFLKLILVSPDKEIIDYSWNERILRLVWTRVEIENAFSWLSTLGGAYSALGDYFEYCAEEAGRISIRQYKLSKMLGDESLAARSRLYLALAYSQRGNLKCSRNIVRDTHKYACLTHDKRLVRMCQGVWAKLKYLRSLQKKEKEGKIGARSSVNGKVVNLNY